MHGSRSQKCGSPPRPAGLSPLALLMAVAFAWAAGPAPAAAAEPEPVQFYDYTVVRTYSHDTRAFTQGLVYHDGFLYEGTGLYGRSILTKRELETGKIIKKSRLPRQYFGEGVTLFGDKVYQLTWKSHKGFTYNKDTFRLLDEFAFTGQGWGLTHDGKRLILSDGTDRLRFLDPNTYAETGRLNVRHAGRPLRQLNELEYVDGKIYANVLSLDYIAIIDPATGRVTGWIDLRDLYKPDPSTPSNAVLNGIAYMPENGHLLVTGKLWPRIYEIQLVPRDAITR